MLKWKLLDEDVTTVDVTQYSSSNKRSYGIGTVYVRLTEAFCGKPYSLLKVMWFKHSTTQGFYNTFNSNLAFIVG